MNEARPFLTVQSSISTISTGSAATPAISTPNSITPPPLRNGGELKRLVITAATTAATLGYDVGIMAAAIHPIEAEMQLSSVQKELAMGSLNFIAALGALMGGVVANGKGRKPTVSLCCWLFVAGTLCMALAPNYGWLLLGRIVTGLGVGVSVVVAPVFLAEVAPTEKRGQINTVFDVAVNGGILLGYVVGFLVELLPLQSYYKWRLMLGLGLVLPLLVLWCLSLLPESPRWLVMANQSSQAREVLVHLGQSEDESLHTVQSIEEELASERQLAHYQNHHGHPNTTNNAHDHTTITTNNKPKWFNLSNGTKLAIGLGFWQQATGTEAVLYYSADFLARAGLDSSVQRLMGNIFIGICKLIPELLAMRSVDRMGRRPLMIASGITLTISIASLAFAFHESWSPVWVVLLLCAVMASYSIGIGPFSFLVASENLGLSERATGMTLCAAANRCTSGVVALSTVSMYEALGDAGFFALYATIAFGSLVFYYTQVPETSGQSLEELAALRARGGRSLQQHVEDSANYYYESYNDDRSTSSNKVQHPDELQQRSPTTTTANVDVVELPQVK